MKNPAIKFWRIKEWMLVAVDMDYHVVVINIDIIINRACIVHIVFFLKPVQFQFLSSSDFTLKFWNLYKYNLHYRIPYTS